MLSLESNWVRWEIDKALTEEKKRAARVLYPVMIDDALLHWDDPRASRLRETLAADFRRAQEGEAFTSALDRLCESLGY
jgi:hypothetical protein